MTRTIKLPPGKYKIRRFISTRYDSWRVQSGGRIVHPQEVEAHWVETIIKSDEQITITKVK